MAFVVVVVIFNVYFCLLKGMRRVTTTGIDTRKSPNPPSITLKSRAQTTA